MLRQSYKRIHFIGAGGAGVSALAHLMLQEGREVSGSDCQESDVTRALAQAGATIWIGHDERQVRLAGRPADLVVYSTAVSPTNPELVYARESGIPLVTRQQFLTYCAMRKDAIVVSGSHGKSTTTCMLATAFIAAQQDPTIVLGSQLLHDMGAPSIDGTSSARHGESRWFLCEGDESNNSMLELQAKVAVVTNIDRDHMDFHGDMSNLKNAFIRFLNSPGSDGMAVVCSDDANVRSILGSITTPVITYGFHPERGAMYFAENPQSHPNDGISFQVHHRDRGPLGIVSLNYPGQHNVLNALATIAICLENGLPFGVVAAALENFPGVRRRYERVYRGRVDVIDDYAHHPSEITALLTAAREVFPTRRMRVVFQPHRFTRSKNLAEQFPGAFMAADEIVLAPIYTAHEPTIPGVGVDYLNRFFAEQYDGTRLACMSDLGQITDYLYSSLRDGDVVFTVGAGTVNNVAYDLAARLRRRDAESSSELDLELIEAEISGEGIDADLKLA